MAEENHPAQQQAGIPDLPMNWEIAYNVAKAQRDMEAQKAFALQIDLNMALAELREARKALALTAATVEPTKETVA